MKCNTNDNGRPYGVVHLLGCHADTMDGDDTDWRLVFK
jgi:hypothetical protein